MDLSLRLSSPAGSMASGTSGRHHGAVLTHLRVRNHAPKKSFPKERRSAGRGWNSGSGQHLDKRDQFKITRRGAMAGFADQIN